MTDNISYFIHAITSIAIILLSLRLSRLEGKFNKAIEILLEETKRMMCKKKDN